MNKVAAKYGGRDKLRAKYGKQLPPAIMAEMMKATMSLVQEQTRQQMQKLQMPLMQKQMRRSNILHGPQARERSALRRWRREIGDARPEILWYKPTGTAEYRVIYADLSVKDLTADEVEKLPGRPNSINHDRRAGKPSASRTAEAVFTFLPRGATIVEGGHCHGFNRSGSRGR